eukprot:TRINITY_DN19131_c0_g1::TRINITY_DN19131_c0_g1_i1::g.13896::m.13896 TRINITY_DN19131_c0_g1::TRINITY_DN19131_c0_g1_i1::g.13896  ORF type:complete len:138 (-),score=11.81,sp/Q9D581/EFC10_MOUSE/34.09/1e-12,RIIa/PF02197.12/0.0089 TRINITY_DN19131_c0_g1_i1:491-904(-)
MPEKSPQKLAEEYLDTYKIHPLFEHLSTLVLYHRPADPHQFLIEELTKMRESAKINITIPHLFSTEDIRTMFGMFDMLNTGTISRLQYKEATISMGLPFVEPPDHIDRLNVVIFTELIKQAIALHQQSLLSTPAFSS